MSTMQELLDSRPRRGRGCPICGNRNTHNVAVRIQTLGENGAIYNGVSTARSLSLCEQHAVEIFTRLIGQIEELRAP